MAEANQSYLRCRVGSQWYGIDVSNVIEVLNFMLLTQLPGTADDILGMMTLRDMVMPVLDLRLHFRVSNVELMRDTPIVAIQTGSNALGLVVDDVDDLVDVHPSQITPHDDGVSQYITDIARMDNGLLLLLDVSLLSAETAHLK